MQACDLPCALGTAPSLCKPEPDSHTSHHWELWFASSMLSLCSSLLVGTMAVTKPPVRFLSTVSPTCLNRSISIQLLERSSTLKPYNVTLFLRNVISEMTGMHRRLVCRIPNCAKPLPPWVSALHPRLRVSCVSSQRTPCGVPSSATLLRHPQATLYITLTRAHVAQSTTGVAKAELVSFFPPLNPHFFIESLIVPSNLWHQRGDLEDRRGSAPKRVLSFPSQALPRALQPKNRSERQGCSLLAEEAKPSKRSPFSLFSPGECGGLGLRWCRPKWQSPCQRWDRALPTHPGSIAWGGLYACQGKPRVFLPTDGNSCASFRLPL